MDYASESPKAPSTAPAPVAPGAPAVTTAASPAEKKAVPFGTRELALVAMALVGGGVITYATLMGRPAPATGTETAPASRTAASAPAARPAKTASKSQQWTAARRELWLGERRKGLAFDVTSNEPVGAWMKNVRPVLVVRCTSGSMETFVVTETAAQIEPKSDAHTVSLRFDDQTPVTERWPDSTEHDALFAPDGADFVSRLATARTFYFRFTPHNAIPVTAEFNVEGLAPLLAPGAKHCGPSVKAFSDKAVAAK